MSLLDGPPHSVSVQIRSLIPGPHGSSLEDVGDPVTVGVSFQPLSAAESADFDGTVAFTQKKAIARTWPGDANSVVTASDGVYDCVGDPQHYAMSPATDHWEIVLRHRGDTQ